MKNEYNEEKFNCEGWVIEVDKNNNDKIHFFDGFDHHYVDIEMICSHKSTEGLSSYGNSLEDLFNYKNLLTDELKNEVDRIVERYLEFNEE